jgi:hypothetical protein
VIFLHGGWWESEYDLEYAGHLCEALKIEGFATWALVRAAAVKMVHGRDGCDPRVVGC